MPDCPRPPRRTRPSAPPAAAPSVTFSASGADEPRAGRALSRRLAAGPPDAATVAGPPALDVLRLHGEGLVDVAYGTVDSPLGELLVAVTEAGLVRLSWVADGTGPVLEMLARTVSPRVLEAPSRTDRVRRQLDEYFAGRRRRFDVEVDWRLTAGFGRAILQATAAIPCGEVRTYSQMAADAGSPRAARAAGNALGANPIPIVVPCHRVVRAGGHLGGYTGGLDRKRHLLRLEGVL